MKNVCILGVTGSIGTQTLEIIRKEKDNFSLLAVSANTTYEKTIEIICEFKPRYAAITDKNNYEKIKEFCKLKDFKIEILYGMDGLITIASLPMVDIVVTSLVGMVGLRPTLSAICAGKDIALANKETLVVGGQLVMSEAKKHNVKILPVDSEHGAIFQCLQGNDMNDIDKILLTASGGPFRGRKKEELTNVTSKEALNHPKWNMGRKISIDSATLMNKGLEVIEAHWLFNMEYDNINVIVHPQSYIHSMVEYRDGSVIAQLACTDMKLPIQYALNYPLRNKNIIDKLDFFSIGNLTFEKPDYETFICLKLAYKAGEIGGLMPTILNAANEIAVDLFLKDRIKFLSIGDIVEETMDKFNVNTKDVTLESILEMDSQVRKYVNNKYNLL
ncbi:MAG: 1-deoxy-D-xylulose-5-phosphate reductoisomerase [Bacillota bacterium]|nr:1-deoxy-D-xylulose-5-phosphate reductoisomerase [Bacillota bacterium]